MVYFRLSWLRALVAAALLAPVPWQAVEEKALLGRLDGSKALVELLQQQEALQEMQRQAEMSPFQDPRNKNAKRDFNKRESEIKRAITHEQARIKSVKNSCKELFAKGGKKVLEAKDKQGRTLLMHVASLGLDDATEMVLRDHPALDVRDKDGMTALDYEEEAGGTAIHAYAALLWANAVNAGDEAAVEELLDSGVNASDLVGEEPAIAIALRGRKTGMVNLLAHSEANMAARTKEGYGLLEFAVMMDYPEAVSILLTSGADDGSKFSNGATPLFHMATKGSAACFAEYVSTSMRVDKETLPCLITRVGSAEKIRVVVKDAATANREDRNGNIPVHEAARRGDVAVFRQMLETGGSRTAVNSRGETTLMHAALSGNPEIVRLAMEGLNEQQLRATDKKGANAAEYAKRSRSQEIFKMLGAAGVKPKK